MNSLISFGENENIDKLSSYNTSDEQGNTSRITEDHEKKQMVLLGKNSNDQL